jgi:hypothetical protein
MRDDDDDDSLIDCVVRYEVRRRAPVSNMIWFT